MQPADVRAPVLGNDEDLQRVRTLAQKTLTMRLSPPAGLAHYAKQLLDLGSDDLYSAYNITPMEPSNHTAQYTAPSADTLREANRVCLAVKQLVGAPVESLTVAACREQSFHHDEVNSEEHAYVAWVLDQNLPMTFHTMGTRIDLTPGDFLVFDAQNPHALLRDGVSAFNDSCLFENKHRFVFALGVIALTPKLRRMMGIKIEPMPEHDFRWMRHVDYSEDLGFYEEKAPASGAYLAGPGVT